MHPEPIVHMQFTDRPTLRQRLALRLIGLGVLLLCDRPVYALVRYAGLLAQLGSWTLTENEKVQKVAP